MNVMNTHIKITKKFITDYYRLILDKNFNRKISDEFIETYIKVRYNELDNFTNRSELKVEILSKLEGKKSILIAEYPDKKETIDIIRIFYNYILYFDYVIQNKDMYKIIENVSEKRKMLLDKEDYEFPKNLSKLCQKYREEVQEVQENVQSPEFYLRQRTLSEKYDLHEGILMYNIKFPSIYSDFSIQKAFETNKVNEDKQFVTFHLIARSNNKRYMSRKNEKTIYYRIYRYDFRKEAKSKQAV